MMREHTMQRILESWRAHAMVSIGGSPAVASKLDAQPPLGAPAWPQSAPRPRRVHIRVNARSASRSGCPRRARKGLANGSPTGNPILQNKINQQNYPPHPKRCSRAWRGTSRTQTRPSAPIPRASTHSAAGSMTTLQNCTTTYFPCDGEVNVAPGLHTAIAPAVRVSKVEGGAGRAGG